jgi:hypothetical protein
MAVPNTFIITAEESLKCIVATRAESLIKEGVQYDFLKERQQNDEDKQQGLKLGHKVWLPKGIQLLKNDNLAPDYTFRPSKAKGDALKIWYGYAKCKLHTGDKIRIWCLLADFVPGQQIEFNVDPWTCKSCEQEDNEETVEEPATKVMKFDNIIQTSTDNITLVSLQPRTSQEVSTATCASESYITVQKPDLTDTVLKQFQWEVVQMVIQEFNFNEPVSMDLQAISASIKSKVDDLVKVFTTETGIIEQEVGNISEDMQNTPGLLSPVPSMTDEDAENMMNETFCKPSTSQTAPRVRRQVKSPQKLKY